MKFPCKSHNHGYWAAYQVQDCAAMPGRMTTSCREKSSQEISIRYNVSMWTRIFFSIQDGASVLRSNGPPRAGAGADGPISTYYLKYIPT